MAMLVQNEEGTKYHGDGLRASGKVGIRACFGAGQPIAAAIWYRRSHDSRHAGHLD
jgi:hypothetical protein